MTEFVAKRTLYAPGTSVAGYQPGHPVDESVVEAWGLVLDEDVVEGTELPAEDVPALTRPGEAATRADWERWAVANGMSREDAAVAAQEALEKVQPAETDQQGNQIDRPADSARKADWVDYVIARGADQEWARADTTTKAQLQDWTTADGWSEGAAAGDTVATSATEANQA